MKFRVSCLIALALLWSMQMAGQTRGGHVHKNVQVIHDSVKIIGPDGAPDGNDAPAVLVVQGGRGGDGGVNNANSGNGGGIEVTAGNGGASSQDAGSGGSITLKAGAGGTSSEVGGSGGSITLQPGNHRCGVPGLCGLDGNVILAVPKHGFVGIGTTSPGNTLEVVAGGTTLADAWTVRSSRRFKTNIRPLEGALETIEQLQGVSYQRKSDGRHEIGVVAEDVDSVLPEVVSRDSETNEVQGVDYARLAALLIEAVKSQQAEIQQLKAQVVQLQANGLRQQ
jgi:hypothetical protein